jgi:hypothetical protein
MLAANAALLMGDRRFRSWFNPSTAAVAMATKNSTKNPLRKASVGRGHVHGHVSGREMSRG